MQTLLSDSQLNCTRRIMFPIGMFASATQRMVLRVLAEKNKRFTIDKLAEQFVKRLAPGFMAHDWVSSVRWSVPISAASYIRSSIAKAGSTPTASSTRLASSSRRCSTAPSSPWGTWSGGAGWVDRWGWGGHRGRAPPETHPNPADAASARGGRARLPNRRRAPHWRDHSR